MAASALLCAFAHAGETLSGRPTVIEGDTLSLRGTLIGLAGVAAPGLAQTCQAKGGGIVPCGRQAATALSEHVGQAVIACESRGRDAFHRTMAICRLGNEDLNAWMVSSGLAVSERFSDATYYANETKAWAKRRGLWAGVFEDPTGRPRGDYAPAAEPAVPTADAGERGPVEAVTALRLSKLAK